MPSQPKFVGLDARAGWLWIKGDCWSGEHLTDGFVPAHVACALAQEVDPQQALIAGEHPMIALLVSRKIWRRTKKGYISVGFLERNPSAEELRHRRDVLRAGRAAGGKARAEAASRDGGKFASRRPAQHQQAKPAQSSRNPAGASPATEAGAIKRIQNPPLIPPFAATPKELQAMTNSVVRAMPEVTPHEVAAEAEDFYRRPIPRSERA